MATPRKAKPYEGDKRVFTPEQIRKAREKKNSTRRAVEDTANRRRDDWWV